jgi:membrane protease YdiL (CAAX protease family)
MKRHTISLRIFIGLIILYALLAAVSVFLPEAAALAGYEYPASKPVMALANFAIILVIYGGLGYLGYVLSRKVGFPDIWDPGVTNTNRFLVPAFIGVTAGIFLILGDQVFSRYNTVGLLPHPPFPTSLVASFTAGIGEEIIFRLLFISFWVWLISDKILKGKKQNAVFWVISLLSALAFAFAHIPAFMFLNHWKSFAEIPGVLLTELILLNGVVGLLAAWYFRKAGYLAAIGIHFWTDIVWHLAWGLAGS